MRLTRSEAMAAWLADPVHREQFAAVRRGGARVRGPRIESRSREKIIAACDPDTQRMIRELEAERRAK